MPNRVIKESIWRSPNLNQCSRLDCEFFFRLLPDADDFGCFEADPLILHGKLYPRIYQMISDEEICNHLIALANNGIIGLWVEDGTLWGYFINWEKHQTIRNIHRRKTPPEDKKLINNQDVMNYLKSIACACLQLISSEFTCSTNPNPNPNPNPNLNPNLNPENTSAGGEKKSSPPARLPEIGFDFEKWDFVGITENDKNSWTDAYPAISVDLQIKKAREWVKSHPENRKKLWRKFLNGWLMRAQEKAPAREKKSRDPCVRTSDDWARDMVEKARLEKENSPEQNDKQKEAYFDYLAKKFPLSKEEILSNPKIDRSLIEHSNKPDVWLNVFATKIREEKAQAEGIDFNTWAKEYA